MKKAKKKESKVGTLKLYISGHAGAAGLLNERPDEFDVILYTNSNYPPPRPIVKNARDFIHFSVDDIDTERHGHVMPSAITVVNFLDWCKGKNEILCVCHAGISRSSATAYVIAASRADPEEAMKVLIPNRHWPNRRIVWLGSQILEQPDIWKWFVDWQLGHTGMDPEMDFDFPEVSF